MNPQMQKQKSARPMSDREFAEALNHFETKRARREAFELLALVNPAGAALSQLAAEDLKAARELIHRAANEDVREFFIHLGKLLEGKRLKPNTWSKLDHDTAFILCFDPKIKSPDAVALLKKLGHPEMTPESFKQKRYNWKRAATRTRLRLEKSGWRYNGNSFLDGETA